MYAECLNKTRIFFPQDFVAVHAYIFDTAGFVPVGRIGVSHLCIKVGKHVTYSEVLSEGSLVVD